jgi:hypothetical protein
MAIPTATEIREFLEHYQIDASIVADAWIENRRDNTVIPYIEHITQMTLEQETELTEYYSGNGEETLILKNKNAKEVIEISYVVAPDIDGRISLSNIILIPGEGIIKMKYGEGEFYYSKVFRKGRKNIKIKYKVGEATLPNDLKECIMCLVADMMLSFIADRTGGGNLSTQGWSRNFGEMGKYTNIRKKLNRLAISVIKRYSSGII